MAVSIQYIPRNMHTVFALMCSVVGYTLTDFPISIRLTSLALWQSNDCPSASKATLMNMDEYFIWMHYERLHNHNKAKHNKTVCKFLGIYCTSITISIFCHLLFFVVARYHTINLHPSSWFPWLGLFQSKQYVKHQQKVRCTSYYFNVKAIANAYTSVMPNKVYQLNPVLRCGFHSSNGALKSTD